MSKSIEKLRKNAIEASEVRTELEEQKKINVSDLSAVDDLLSIPLEDASSVLQIESLSKSVNDEQEMINEKIIENQNIIDDTLVETDDYIESFESNIKKYERMEQVTGLVDIRPSIEASEAKIDELEEVRRILDDGAAPRRNSGYDTYTGFDTISDGSIEFQKYEPFEQKNEKAPENQEGIAQITNNESQEYYFFEQKLSMQDGLYGAYKNEIINRFNMGNPAAQRAFVKYVPNNSVVDYKFKKASHFSTIDRKIRMNFDEDLTNVRGSGIVYFHEHGHLIDMARGYPVSDDTVFRDALIKDFETFIMNYMNTYRVTAIEAYSSISASDEFWQDSHSAVSDLFGAMSRGEAEGKWGHENHYWEIDSTNLTTEAFAHFYEAQFNKERLKILTTYFPSAAKEFNRLLGGL